MYSSLTWTRHYSRKCARQVLGERCLSVAHLVAIPLVLQWPDQAPRCSSFLQSIGLLVINGPILQHFQGADLRIHHPHLPLTQKLRTTRTQRPGESCACTLHHRKSSMKPSNLDFLLLPRRKMLHLITNFLQSRSTRANSVATCTRSSGMASFPSSRTRAVKTKVLSPMVNPRQISSHREHPLAQACLSVCIHARCRRLIPTACLPRTQALAT